jgi:GrpB-like predicted nucleotidyltransferase (UPF0157 family)
MSNVRQLAAMPEAIPLADRAIREPIELAPYDPAWPQAFCEERDRLLSVFPTMLLAIEHIGSTAVPGMPAKPIVDILAGLESMSVADALFEPILANGYTTSRAFNEMLPDRRWFMRVTGGKRSHHLHVVQFEGLVWRRHLLFRHRLRAAPTVADDYARLKTNLAVQYRHDREAYTEAKSAFVASVVESP